ncbi:MAG: hypothetical protein AB1813_13520, partial [Verrucomicrobiota bacterium]
WMACAQKKLEPTHVRLLREPRFKMAVASNVSSIICFWSKRLLVIGSALAGSQDGQRDFSRGNAHGRLDGMRAEKVRADSRQAATGAWI